MSRARTSRSRAVSSISTSPRQQRWRTGSSRRCWRGKIEVALTAREFAVLEHLARHPGDVLSKREILAHVWDDDFLGDPNIVEVYVRYLRRKIDIPFGRESIETVRGAGYRLRVQDG